MKPLASQTIIFPHTMWSMVRLAVAAGEPGADRALDELCRLYERPISSNQALDARRNYMMNWSQYSREESQRAVLQSQNQARTAVSGEALKVGWAAKVDRLRTNLDTRYRAFRAALR